MRAPLAPLVHVPASIGFVLHCSFHFGLSCRFGVSFGLGFGFRFGFSFGGHEYQEQKLYVS